MATESVNAVRQASPDYYGDSNSYEATNAALNASLALNAIIADVTVGENTNTWADRVVDNLHTGQRILLLAAKRSLEDLRLEHWHAHAMLGEYGLEAKARAEAAAEAQP